MNLFIIIRRLSRLRDKNLKIWELVGSYILITELTVYDCFPCSILLWDPPEGHDVNQGLDSLQKRTEILGAKNCGNWMVDCESYQSSQHVG